MIEIISGDIVKIQICLILTDTFLRNLDSDEDLESLEKKSLRQSFR